MSADPMALASSPDARNWHPLSWTRRPVHQAPHYADERAHDAVIAELSQLPPLVLADESRALKAQLARVARGEARLLQGGDCAESFAEFNAQSLRDTAATLLEMALILSRDQPVVTVGRIAGQFAKPRSSDVERIGDVELPSYRGDIVNGAAFDAQSRQPDPQRMLRAYQQSAITLNLLRALEQSGFADAESIAQRHAQLLARSHLTLHGARELHPQSQRLYTSHEALLLPYESALTRRDSRSGHWYACSAHLLWIGDRTRQLDGAHVEFCSGIANPLAIKCGPSLSPDDLLRLLDRLDPGHEAGRITLIARLGADHVQARLPTLVRAVRASGHPVIWSCDPMHGNTVTAEGGLKTRPFERVVAEISGFVAVHAAEGTHAGGLHLEMTGKDVTECTGGSQAIDESQLALRYHSHCDPRLNALQAIELADRAARLLQADKLACAA